MSLLLEMFTYPFILRAFVVGILISLCAALLGVPLVLKRYSMIGDGLSHVSFGALSVALACGWAPLPVSIPVGVSAAVLVLYVLFYHRLFAITFDESFSRATGMRVGLYNTVLSVLTALTIVLGMRLMGAMLISSLVIFPALTAMRLLRSFRGVVICAGVLSVVCFCAGLTGSYLLSTPVGATVVLADLAAFLLACGAAGLKKRA